MCNKKRAKSESNVLLALFYVDFWIYNRLLTVLSCDLDSWLLLETQYNIQGLLLELQKNNRTFEG